MASAASGDCATSKPSALSDSAISWRRSASSSTTRTVGWVGLDMEWEPVSAHVTNPQPEPTVSGRFLPTRRRARWHDGRRSGPRVPRERRKVGHYYRRPDRKMSSNYANIPELADFPTPVEVA